MFAGSTQFGLRFSDASWLGPLRFGPVPRPVPAGSRIKRFGSAGSFRFLTPSCYLDSAKRSPGRLDALWRDLPVTLVLRALRVLDTLSHRSHEGGRMSQTTPPI